MAPPLEVLLFRHASRASARPLWLSAGVRCRKYSSAKVPVFRKRWLWLVEMIHLAIFLHQGPPAEGVDYSTPHPVVTVELDEQPGLRFTSTVVGADNDDIKIGERVALEWITRDGRPYPAWRLAAGAQ